MKKITLKFNECRVTHSFVLLILVGRGGGGGGGEGGGGRGGNSRIVCLRESACWFSCVCYARE